MGIPLESAKEISDVSSGKSNSASTSQKLSASTVSSQKSRSSRRQSNRLATDAIGFYLTSIGRVPLLTPAEEIELAHHVQQMKDLLSLPLEQRSTRQKHKIKMGKRARDRMMAANLRLVVSVAKKYQNQGLELLDLVQEGAIGQPQTMLRRDGLGLLNRGTHEIDEMRYILGDPEPLWLIGQVSRKTDKWERRVRCEDLCFGEVCFEGGIRGIYESDLPGPGLNGTAVYGDDGQLRRGSEGAIELLNSKTAGWQQVKPRQSEPNQFQEMIQWLDGEIEEHRNAGVHGRTTIEILMAIYESLRIQGVVEFPLTTRENPLDLMVEGGLLPVFQEGRYDIRAPFPEQEK